MKSFKSLLLVLCVGLTISQTTMTASANSKEDSSVVRSKVSTSEIKNQTPFQNAMRDYKDSQWMANYYGVTLIAPNKEDFRLFAFEYIAGNPVPSVSDASAYVDYPDFDEPQALAKDLLSKGYVVAKESGDKGLCLFNLLLTGEIETKSKRKACHNIETPYPLLDETVR